MFEHFEAERAKKKALTGAEKKEIKKAKDEQEAKYTYCLLDGRKEKVGNFRVEPPGLFRGRGEHPKKGALKVYYIMISLCVLNIVCSSGSVRKTSLSTLEIKPLSPSPIWRANGSQSSMTIP